MKDNQSIAFQKRILGIALISMIHFSTTLSVNPSAVISPSHGPENGTLFLTGGQSLPSFLTNKFAALAGGKNCRLLVIPTASSNPTASKVITSWTDKGFTHVSSLHTTDRDVANSDAFAAAVDTADALWLMGGDPVRLSNAYYGTKTQEAFHRLLERGGVIGGESAGSMAQGEWDALYMVDPPLFQLPPGTDYTDYPMLRFVPGLVVIPHINNGGTQKWNWGGSIIRNHPEALGVGIYEGKGFILKKDLLRVHGDSLGIYDSTTIRLTNLKGNFLMLYHGETYDIGTRKQLNFRPRIQQALPNQRVLKNIPFDIDLSSVFIDSNTDDSLTYTVLLVGGYPLPDWIHFDPKRLHLTGTSLNQELVTVVLKVTDRSESSNSILFTIDTDQSQDLSDQKSPVPRLFFNKQTKMLECQLAEIVPRYCEILLFDCLGKARINQTKQTSGYVSIDVSELKGIYVASIRTAGYVYNQKIQIY